MIASCCAAAAVRSSSASCVRRTAQRISLGHFTQTDEERAVDAADVAWLSRILWISQ